MDTTNFDSPSILIVDDNPINAKLLSYWCKKWGHKADIVFSGKAALSKASCSNYTLLIMDILLPNISGIEVAKALRTQQSDAAIIFQSGLSEREFRARTDERHLFLQKPYYPAQMEQAVDFIFQKHAVRMLA